MRRKVPNLSRERSKLSFNNVMEKGIARDVAQTMGWDARKVGIEMRKHLADATHADIRQATEKFFDRG